MNIIVTCGFRGQAEQDKARATGKSKLKWPESKHNKIPALAVDLAPINSTGGIDWDDLKQWQVLVDVVKRTAHEQGIDIVCGADFKSFKDYPHFELV